MRLELKGKISPERTEKVGDDTHIHIHIHADPTLRRLGPAVGLSSLPETPYAPPDGV